MSDRKPSYNSNTMSSYQGETSTSTSSEKKEWKKSEYWCNFGHFTEVPDTGEEDFVAVTGFGIPLDNLEGKEACNDGSWFNTKILAGNGYMEKIKNQAMALEPGTCKYCRIGNTKYAFQILRKKDKTTKSDMSKNLAFDDSLFNFN